MKTYIYERNDGDWAHFVNKKDALEYFREKDPREVRRLVDGDWFWDNGGHRRVFRLHAPNCWWAYCSRGYEFDYDRRRVVGRGLLTDALEGIEPEGNLFRIEDARSLQRLEKQHKGLPLKWARTGSTCGCRSHSYVAPLIHDSRCPFAKKYNPVLPPAAPVFLLRVGQYAELNVDEWMPVERADLEFVEALGYPLLDHTHHDGHRGVRWSLKMREAMEKVAGLAPGTSRDWANAPREMIEIARIEAWKDEALRYERELLEHMRAHAQDETRLARAEARFARAKEKAEQEAEFLHSPGIWLGDPDYPAIREIAQAYQWTSAQVQVAIKQVFTSLRDGT